MKKHDHVTDKVLRAKINKAKKSKGTPQYRSNLQSAMSTEKKVYEAGRKTNPFRGRVNNHGSHDQSTHGKNRAAPKSVTVGKPNKVGTISKSATDMGNQLKAEIASGKVSAKEVARTVKYTEDVAYDLAQRFFDKPNINTFKVAEDAFSNAIMEYTILAEHYSKKFMGGVRSKEYAMKAAFMASQLVDMQKAGPTNRPVDQWEKDDMTQNHVTINAFTGKKHCSAHGEVKQDAKEGFQGKKPVLKKAKDPDEKITRNSTNNFVTMSDLVENAGGGMILRGTTGLAKKKKKGMSKLAKLAIGGGVAAGAAGGTAAYLHGRKKKNG